MEIRALLQELTQHSSSFAFEKLPTTNLIVIMADRGTLKLIVNTSHKYGASLEEQFNRNELSALISTAVWTLASYMTSREDWQKTYPYLLDGVDDIFAAANKNVSAWLENEVDL